jgi:hypothetical protein
MDRLGELLLASELTYACQGFAFALARLGGSTASMHLCAYLDTWLPQLDKRYDQCWVLASLLYLDSLDGTDAGQAYLSSGAWDAWATWRGITQDVDECQVWIRGLADAIATG